MNRLQSELRRLYLPLPCADSDLEPAASSLIDQNGMVRAMVLELARPADWEALSKVWCGVQANLDLPAPAVAVSGTDGFQLWFSLAEAVCVAQAGAFVQSLRSRYLPEIALNRVGVMPAADAATPPKALHARLVPAVQERSGMWSAFVNPDLAPIFADTPWMDSQPGNDGQAGILSRLLSITAPAFDSALERMRHVTPGPVAPTPAITSTHINPKHSRSGDSAGWLDPKRFLLQVINDDTAALALRIEAAKALLPYAE